MFYDLNIPWKPSDPQLPQTLAFLHELGYNAIALNHTISGKIPEIVDITNPVPTQETLQTTHKSLSGLRNFTILRRITLILTETSHQNAKLTALGAAFDILALRVTDEKSLIQACGSLECDIISFDLTQRYQFFFGQHAKILGLAINSGKRIEICYGNALLGDPKARVNLISNATQLIKATKGRGLIISSGGELGARGLRGPWDVINLAAVWGLGQERGYEAMSKEPRGIVVRGKLKRTGYRGAVDVVYGGEKPPVDVEKQGDVNGKGKVKGKQQQQGQKKDGGKHQQQKKAGGQQQQGQKRKADGEVLSSESGELQPMSKRKQKKLAHEARIANGTAGPAASSGAESSSTPAAATSSSAG